ncbi:MAG TPA: serine protease [Hyphomonadaceae bacterium]|nr:MAG: serine protease [Alphaproteobacteria bacterium PA1]HCP64323.1 serine protease [Hyphomonadaceae bacterium]
MLRRFGDGILILLVLIVAAAWMFGRVQDRAELRPPSRPADTFVVPEAETTKEEAQKGPLLPAPSPYDDQSMVEAHRAGPWSSGTGFAIGDNGTWLTARHVALGCERLGVVNGQDQELVAASLAYVSKRADVAILRTQGGPEPLALDLNEDDLQIGAMGFHIGFPQGQPGEVVSRLIGRELMITEGAWRGRENTLAWAEVSRSKGLRGTLGGLSGGPAFDSKGNVIGITIAESLRRGRVITTSSDSIIQALKDARLSPKGDAIAPLRADDITRVANRVRRDLKVIQIVCLPPE